MPFHLQRLQPLHFTILELLLEGLGRKDIAQHTPSNFPSS